MKTPRTEPVTHKWQRATSTRRTRKRSTSWVSHGQLYREIAAGYQHFLAARIRAGAMQEGAP